MKNYHLLLSLPTKGFLFLIFLFLFCFLGVHVVKLALIGVESLHTIPSTDKTVEEKKAPAERPQEPIYYIVERKTRRAKPSYGEPKEIRFK